MLLKELVNTGNLPSLQALSDPNDHRLLVELRLMAVRRQLATFRTIADEIERRLESWSRDPSSIAVDAQLLEEVAALGCRALEAASAAGFNRT